MHMIPVYPYLEKTYLIPLGNFKTHILESFIYFFDENNLSIFCWTYKMVYEYRYIL